MVALFKPTDSNNDCYLKEQSNINNFIFLSPSTDEEVKMMIEELNCNKSKRQLHIETKFIKYSKCIISNRLSQLFNLCLTQGTFPSYLKIAEVIPIFKKR